MSQLELDCPEMGSFTIYERHYIDECALPASRDAPVRYHGGRHRPERRMK